MGIFSRLERPTMRAVTYSDDWGPTDGRWYHPVSGWAQTLSGFPIDPDMAMRVSAVFACTSLLAEVVASLPCILYRRLDDGGKEKAKDHRLYKTLRQSPAIRRKMTPMDYFGTQQMHLGLRGNAMAEIIDDGITVELLPLHPDYVTVELLPSGALRYVVRDPLGGEARNLSQDRVLHTHDLSMNSYTGMSRSILAREAIAVAAAAEGYVGGFFRNDATGRLLVTHPTTLTEEKRKEFRDMMQENYAGWANRSKMMLLSGGVKAEELGKHDDSGFITEPRGFQIAEIARFWRVPLFMIGLEEKSTSWGTGIESQKQAFVDFAVKSWTDRHAQAMSLALLDDSEQEEYFIDFLFADLVRGDLLTRMQAYGMGIDKGIWNPNEVRIKENESPREGGDEYQETPVGGSPNQPKPATPPAPEETPAEQARRIPAPLMADAVQRIANREIDDVGRQLAKATDPAKWSAWMVKYYAGHREYVTKVLMPLTQSYGYDAQVVETVAARVERTATSITSETAPTWLTKRRDEVALVLEETFTVMQVTATRDPYALALDLLRAASAKVPDVVNHIGGPTVNVAPPAVTVEPAVVNVTTPAVQVAAPVVNLPPITVEAPVVHVAPPNVTVEPAVVNVKAPDVTVHTPDVQVNPDFHITIPKDKKANRVIRMVDGDGKVVRTGRITEED